MPLREGDVVTVAYNPVITITQYAPVKPMVSIERRLNKEPVKDFADLMAELRKAYFKALDEEIKIQNNAPGKSEEWAENARILHARCLKEINNGQIKPTIKTSTASG